MDIMHLSVDGDLKIFFIKTTAEEEKRCQLESITQDCTLKRDPDTNKARILVVPSKQLGAHLFETLEMIDGKPPLQFHHSYSKQSDSLLIGLVPNESIPLGSVKTFVAIEDCLLIDKTSVGIIGFEVIGVEYFIGV